MIQLTQAEFVVNGKVAYAQRWADTGDLVIAEGAVELTAEERTQVKAAFARAEDAV